MRTTLSKGMIAERSKGWMMEEMEREFWNAREEMEGARTNKAVFARTFAPTRWCESCTTAHTRRTAAPIFVNNRIPEFIFHFRSCSKARPPSQRSDVSSLSTSPTVSCLVLSITVSPSHSHILCSLSNPSGTLREHRHSWPLRLPIHAHPHTRIPNRDNRQQYVSVHRA